MTQQWGYSSGIGPETWSEKFPLASGSHQSPVDIRSDSCRQDPVLSERPLIVDYRNARPKTLLNPGYCWKVEAEGGVLTGGPLLHRYELEQFHCHWGRTDATGSEHTVDGKTYPAELHLVHWNTDLYQDFGSAAGAGDGSGLSVLGVFLDIGAENKGVTKLLEALNDVNYCGQEVEVSDDLDLTDLLPDDRSYWTYSGSLTTPPCHESVTWIVYKQPITVSQRQLARFREMRAYCIEDECPADEFNGRIVENFRPPLSLGRRLVRSWDAC